MTLETDLLIDRRRLKRRLIIWRSLAILAVLAALLIAAGRLAPGSGELAARHLVRLEVSGIITGDSAQERRIARLADDPSVAGLIVSINSPGGSVTGGEALHDAIARVAAKKPVVTVMGGVAASAGYMIALPAQRIFARGATLTGSIGVILETAEASGLLDRIGVRAEAITSGPLKDQPSFTRGLTPEGRAVLQGLVADIADQFVTMVAEARHMDKEAVQKLADGRAYTGRQALALGLIDELGDEQAARAWLARTRGVPLGTPVRDLEGADWASRFLHAGFAGMLGETARIVTGQGLTLDGAWALWQPSQPGAYQ